MHTVSDNGAPIEGGSMPSRQRRQRRLLAGTMTTLLALGATACSSSTSSSQVGEHLTTAQIAALSAPATFSTPPDAGVISDPISANPSDLASQGYEEQEYFVSGTAWALKSLTTPEDGQWTFAPTTSASYETRIIVRRPVDPAVFDGNVIVEWMNVSAGESAPDFEYFSPTLEDQGAVYIGVSAQALAVNGGAALLTKGIAGPSGGLRGSDPARYGALHHPGDQYSLDMFAQIGEALRQPHPLALGGLTATHVLATGESQSAFYLTTYADTLQKVVPAYQGLFIHSRGSSGVPLGSTDITSAIRAAPVKIRTDLGIPVFMFETQTDLIQLGYAAAQQPNTAHIRTWEVAGTSHADAYELGPAAGFIGCTQQVNDGPQHQVAQAAFLAYLHWADSGTPPPNPQPFSLASRDPAALALDHHGNVIGGVRTPAVDVPVSTLSGAPPKGASTLCGLFGSSVAFTPAQLTALYGTPANYVAQFTASLDRAIREGYLLPSDRAALLAQAQQVAF